MLTTPPWPTPPAGTRAPHRVSVHSLPNELLACVLSHFDASSSLGKRFRDDASTLIDGYYAARGDRPSRRHPLKSVSLVSRRWRAVVLPFLFRHVLWTFRRLEEPAAAAADAGEGFEAMAFLKRHALGTAVDSVTLYVPCPEHLIDDPTELVGRFGVVPSTTSAGTTATTTTTTMQEMEGVDGDAESVVLSETASLVLADANMHATWSNTWFWDLLFSVVDPLRVSILAAPVVLATMLSCKVLTRCQPLMMTRYHLLSVSRADRGSLPMVLQGEDDDSDADHGKDPADPTPPPPPPPTTTTTTTTTDPHVPMGDNLLPCELFARRRWTALLANEGSSVSIYKTDAYGQTPPSPLLSLLVSRDPATRRFLRHHLHRLDYVAIMPMGTHFQAMLAALAHLAPRRLAELFVQIMPRGVDLDHLRYRLGPDDAGARFEGLDMQDLVMERDAVYGMLFTAVFLPGPQPEWEPLRVFETGDADADTIAWAEAIEVVRASTSCWEVAERGRFVRNMAREEARRRRQTSSYPVMSSSSGAL